MCENTKPDLTGKVRFQRGRNENKNTEIYENTYIEESTPSELQDTTEDRWQGNSSSRKWPLVLLVLLCFLLLAAVIVLVVLLIQDICLNAKLSSEKEKLQTSYSEMRSLNTNLTQKTSQLEKERDSLMANNTNLTKQRDELQMKLETCPTKWIKFGNSCYFLSPSIGDWSNSKGSCENLDAQLVIINSQEEQIFLSSLGLDVWIGLTDQNTQLVWKWVDGTVVNTTYWRASQPDNYIGIEYCAQISTGFPPLSNWDDSYCLYLKRFICEKVLK